MMMPRRETASRRLSPFADVAVPRRNAGAMRIHATSTPNCTSARETCISVVHRGLQRAPGEDAHHLAPIFGRQRRGSQRLGGTSREFTDLGSQLFGELLAVQSLGFYQE